MGLLFISLLAFLSCKNDATLNNTFKGKYSVKVKEVNLKELEQASEQIKVDLEKGKKELKEGIEKAQTELDKDVNIEVDGKKVDLKEAMGELGKGLEKVMDGVGDIQNGIGKGITEVLIKNTKFEADFRDEGVLAIGTDNNKFNFSSKNLKWGIKDGKLIIQDADKSKDNFSFDIKSKNEKEWELVSDKITLLLNKAE
jgi:hypothetical protein